MLWQGTGGALREKFRAASRALAATFQAHLAGGRHTYEKGLRHEQVLIDFLAAHLPPRYGVSRGEVVDSKGAIARQADVVIYDAHHAPLLQESGASRVFAAESVYAVIEMKPNLNRTSLADAVGAVRSAKALDRSAVVASHLGHRRLHGPAENPPLFGAVFSLHTTSVEKCIVPGLALLDRRVPRAHRVDAVCVLGEALVYHFAEGPGRDGQPTWCPTIQTQDSRLGYYASKDDTLFLFYLFLLYQLGARELHPPDLLRYVARERMPRLRVYQGDRVPPRPKPASKGRAGPSPDKA
ncbi:MAG TPA: hypothetical protein PLE19_21080 [Planctomycetota bacterium]|nr:hypothetical protein [Planctomycetota bacterium]HRR82895.1 hypothetical protein [Planctomycetota bacterium]HRT93245.1 hypothetical protein [Planctomycetota bacterium]